MSKEKRLHPIAAVSNAFKLIKESFLPLIALLVFGGDRHGPSALLDIFLVPSLVAGLIVYGILNWYRFTYRIEDREIRIESGVLFKKKRYIRFERIHSIDVSEGILQRLFGLVKVKIETAGNKGGRAEAELTAISKAEAVEIDRLFFQVKYAASDPVLDADHMSSETQHEHSKSEPGTNIFSLSFRKLLLMAATSGGVGVVFSGTVAFISQFDEIIPFDAVFKGFAQFAKSSVLTISLMLFIGLVLAYFAAAVGVLLRYAHFTVWKKDEDIIITRGLLERRQLTIPIKKIQGIRITENLMRQPLGYATVYVEYAGGSVLDKESANIMLFPIIKKETLADLVQQTTGDYKADSELNPVPARSFSRYIWRKGILALPLAAVCSILYWPWGLITFVSLLPLAALWGYFCYKDAGWLLNGSQLQLRYRFLSRQTVVLRKNRIQSMDFESNWFQQKRQLSSLSATVATGAAPRTGEVKDVDLADSLKIKAWFSNGRR
ncbi:PH domain-containing protein [Peribacillus sp. SCS-155]|uniref:PH domain-containing protein n=1 Tax=Peribacillus sedimenti TaxID=3115297 RepID=UPI00390659AC